MIHVTASFELVKWLTCGIFLTFLFKQDRNHDRGHSDNLTSRRRIPLVLNERIAKFADENKEKFGDLYSGLPPIQHSRFITAVAEEADVCTEDLNMGAPFTVDGTRRTAHDSTSSKRKREESANIGLRQYRAVRSRGAVYRKARLASATKKTRFQSPLRANNSYGTCHPVIVPRPGLETSVAQLVTTSVSVADPSTPEVEASVTATLTTKPIAELPALLFCSTKTLIAPPGFSTPKKSSSVSTFARAIRSTDATNVGPFTFGLSLQKQTPFASMLGIQSPGTHTLPTPPYKFGTLPTPLYKFGFALTATKK